MPVTYLKGVGERRAACCARLGIVTAGDLLRHIPHWYEDASTISPIGTLATGADATIIGTVISKGVLPTRRGLKIFQVVLRDDSGMIEVSWPGQPFLDRVIDKQDVLLVTGTVRFFHGRQLQAREFVNLGAEAADTSTGSGAGRVPDDRRAVGQGARSPLDQHLDTLLPLAAESLSSASSQPVACHHCRKRSGWCIARHSLAGGGARAVHGWPSRSCCPYRCCIVVRMRLARAHRSGIAYQNRPITDDGAQARAALRAHDAQTRACARSSRTCAARRRCTGCCRAMSAAARPSWRSSRRCWRWTTAIRPRSWRRRNSLPNSTGARFPRCSSRWMSVPSCSRAVSRRRNAAQRPIASLARSRRSCRNARARAGGDDVRSARPGDHRRAAPVRRRAAQGPGSEGRQPGRTPAERDADPSVAGADGVRRSRCQCAG